MKAFLGDFVKTRKNNYEGRVYAKHHNFYHTDEDIDWFKIQELPDSCLQEIWYSILINGYGAVLVPESDLYEVWDIKGDFSNPYNGFHFKD